MTTTSTERMGARNRAMNGPVRKMLVAMQRGELTFDEFARASHAYWFAHAERMRARWSVPPSLGVEDIVQHMMMGAWMASRRYDPTRGVPYATFVVVGAMHEGLRVIHHQRRSLRRSGRAPSRYDICESAWFTSDDNSVHRTPLEKAVAEELDVDGAVDGRMRIERAIINSVGTTRAFVLAAVNIAGDVESAADMIYRDRACRDAIGVYRRHDIGKLVAHHVATL